MWLNVLFVEIEKSYIYIGTTTLIINNNNNNNKTNMNKKILKKEQQIFTHNLWITFNTQ